MEREEFEKRDLLYLGGCCLCKRERRRELYKWREFSEREERRKERIMSLWDLWSLWEAGQRFRDLSLQPSLLSPSHFALLSCAPLGGVSGISVLLCLLLRGCLLGASLPNG